MIKLTEYFNDTTSYPVWVNHNLIAFIRETDFGSQISMSDHAYIRVLESPSEILSLIPEVQP